jgi:pimeloyl-ACP methyl ester carboxylesterase
VGDANAAALLTALLGLLKAYDVRTDGLRYYGSSGGSIFLTQEWLPLHGGAYPGVFALMCGGEVSTRAWGWDVTDASLRAKSPLFFTYGDQDFLLPDITKAIADLTGRGFALTSKVVPNATHCAFDAHGEAVGIWSAHP